jgi:intracellular sulfur oxidation DsrE/DsrF family protein
MKSIAGKLLSLWVLSLLLASTVWAADNVSHVVVQVSDNDVAKWNLALGNVKNLQIALGEQSTDIEVVVYGPGIGMLTLDSPVSDKIAAALKSHVKIVACENTLRAAQLTKDDLLDGVGTVPSGVAEIVKRQQAGYAYVRP